MNMSGLFLKTFNITSAMNVFGTSLSSAHSLK